MLAKNQANQKSLKLLFNDLSAPAWDIYDNIALLALGIVLAFYFVFHGMYVNYIWGTLAGGTKKLGCCRK